MAKLTVMNYWNNKGEKKLNCYRFFLSKEVVKESGFTREDNLKARAEKGVIYIEREDGDI